MPRIPGNDHTNGRVWNELYESTPLSIGYAEATRRASTGTGRNGAAILSRIEYIRKAISSGLVSQDCIDRAEGTIKALEAQLDHHD